MFIYLLAAIIGADYSISSWSLIFTSGQSQYNQSTSCAHVFIINDTTLEDTEYVAFEFTTANRTKYLPFRTNVTVTIFEDPNDSTFYFVAWSNSL